MNQQRHQCGSPGPPQALGAAPFLYRACARWAHAAGGTLVAGGGARVVTPAQLGPGRAPEGTEAFRWAMLREREREREG